MPIYPNTIEGTEVTRTMTQLLAFIATLGCFLHLSLGWCPSHNVEDMVIFSDIVLVGTVTEIIPDPSPSAYPETYGAKIDVRCAYEGGLEPRRVPETITIGGAGE